MADAPDDDATRIYRPYGSPPPDPDATTPDPFAPKPPPLAADPFAADPFAPEPTAPEPAALEPAAPDPFAPEPASQQTASPTPSDPFAADPFAPSATADPFRPAADATATDPFAPELSPPPAEASPSSTPDPFAPPPAVLPPAPPASDPFAAPPAATPSPFDLSVADPFAPPPALPTVDSVPARPADPFTAAPTTASDDPFAAYHGPVQGRTRESAFDSGLHAAPGAGLELDLPDVFGAEQTLAGAFTPVFSLILQLRASTHLGDPTALRQRIEALLLDAARRARATGASDADVEEAQFCLVAFLDEAILSSDWPGRDAWSAEPLQLTHYDRYDAGERVFDRLKSLLDEGAARTDVLEVYYLCLALGFKGRYAIQGRDVLRRLIDDLQRRLEQTPSRRVGVLAPRGLSREVPAQAEKGGIPAWALWVGAAVLVALLYVGLSVSLSSVAGETADDLRTIQSTAR